jgi:hypothetical protein
MDTPFKDEGAAESHTPLRRFSPIFPVRDLRRALAHYASLGFEMTPVPSKQVGSRRGPRD